MDIHRVTSHSTNHSEQSTEQTQLMNPEHTMEEEDNTIWSAWLLSDNEQFPLTSIRNVAKGQIEFDTSTLLGRGSRSFVYKGKFKTRNVAIKRIPCVDITQMKEYLNNFQPLLEYETHVNLVEIYGCFLENTIDEVFVPMEICDGNLIEWRNGEIDNIQVDFDSYPVHRVLKDIGKGVEFLHSKSITHGDLKPSNILVCQAGNQYIRLKLVDFGISQICSSERKEWYAPEMFEVFEDEPTAKKSRLNVSEMSSKSDIFCLGLVYYWILTARFHPFGEDFVDREYNLKEYNNEFTEDHFSNKWDLGHMKLLKKMLSKNPKDRPSIDKLLYHHIFWSNEKISQFLKKVHDALKINVVTAEEINDKLSFTDNWSENICPDVKIYLETLQYHKTRSWNSVTHLLRVIKVVEMNYQELPEKARIALGSQDKMLKCYWLNKFPYLVQILWESCRELKTHDNKFNLNEFYGMEM